MGEVMTAAPQSHPMTDQPTPEQFQAWADEAQACVDSDEVIITDHEKANATIMALRSRASLKARIEELEGALRFIADGYDNQDVNHVDYRVKVYQVALDALGEDA